MIKLNSIYKSFNINKKCENNVLNNINAEFTDGTITAIMGKSGVGKTTLLNIISCLLPMDKGEYEFYGSKIGYSDSNKLALMRNTDIGIVLQNFSLIPDYTVLENVILPVYFGKGSLVAAKKKALDLLNQVGLKGFEKQKVRNLSGGQQQRVAICRALINDPKLIVADEPTGSLDQKNSQDIIRLLKSLINEKRIIIVATHDMEIAKECDIILNLDETGIHRMLSTDLDNSK